MVPALGIPHFLELCFVLCIDAWNVTVPASDDTQRHREFAR